MPPPLRCPSSLPLTCCSRQLFRPAQSSRCFSTTPHNEQRVTRARRQLFIWLATRGAVHREPLPDSTNYLSAYNQKGEIKRLVRSTGTDESRPQGQEEGRRPSGNDRSAKLPRETIGDLRPFPQNDSFVSERVLSTGSRMEIWRRVIEEGKSVRTVSAELGVSMARVGAVVRLKEIEAEWKRIGKPLARSYARAVMAMLPQTKLDEDGYHEPINDLPVHAYTGTQIFHPTPESRHFTRADAARVFNENLLPADDRIPHPQLIETHKDRILGLSSDAQEARANEREQAENKRMEKNLQKQAKKDATVIKVETPRWEFKFTPIHVDHAGKTGRDPRGVGWRYGAPHMDRSRGAHKIPTSVG